MLNTAAENKLKLIDPYNRFLNYLRISIIDRCNLKCMYCVPDGKIPKLSHLEILSYEELLRIITVGAQLGISKVRITGGEPLVRKNVFPFLEKITAIKALSDVSLTTNGVLLIDSVDALRSAGIKRINVSLDTLDRAKYKTVTGRDHFDRVWAGILAAQKAGFYPIKLNMVVLSGINEDEFLDFARLSFTYPFHIRFIEYMPIGNPRMKFNRDILAPEIKRRLEAIGELIPAEKEDLSGPAERYRFKGAMGEIGFIRPISRHFCGSCNRLRLTASGQIRTCLLSDDQVDLKGPMRKGCSDNELAEILIKSIRHKPSEHHLLADQEPKVSSEMSAIGG
ncbi:MAG: GTP 3',8-cyclase MoaA [Desulfobacterales bacterium]|nr:GTP 3',8-cyclase MoaA [Desulfobacterales bacterium]